MNVPLSYPYSSMAEELAENYHLASRNLAVYRHLPPNQGPPPSPDPPPSPLPGTITLENGEVGILPPLDTTILSRRSHWNYASVPVSKPHLSQLLYLSNGLQAGQGRTVANAGNLGSVTLYPMILAPGGEIPAGIYAYESVYHELIPVKLGHFQTWFATQVALQPQIGEAPLAIALVSDVERLRQKYGHRSYRLALLDAGHVSAHLYLVATALGLNICACAGFVDDEINLGLGLDGLDQTCMLISVIGQDRG